MSTNIKDLEWDAILEDFWRKKHPDTEIEDAETIIPLPAANPANFMQNPENTQASTGNYTVYPANYPPNQGNYQAEPVNFQADQGYYPTTSSNPQVGRENRSTAQENTYGDRSLDRNSDRRRYAQTPANYPPAQGDYPAYPATRRSGTATKRTRVHVAAKAANSTGNLANAAINAGHMEAEPVNAVGTATPPNIPVPPTNMAAPMSTPATQVNTAVPMNPQGIQGSVAAPVNTHAVPAHMDAPAAQINPAVPLNTPMTPISTATAPVNPQVTHAAQANIPAIPTNPAVAPAPQAYAAVIPAAPENVPAIPAMNPAEPEGYLTNPVGLPNAQQGMEATGEIPQSLKTQQREDGKTEFTNDIEFDIRFRGYDRYQVDHYLDAITEDYNGICKKCHALEKENRGLRRALATLEGRAMK